MHWYRVLDECLHFSTQRYSVFNEAIPHYRITWIFFLSFFFYSVDVPVLNNIPHPSIGTGTSGYLYQCIPTSNYKSFSFLLCLFMSLFMLLNALSTFILILLFLLHFLALLLCLLLLTLELATRPSPSSWISLSTICSFSHCGMEVGRRSAAEKFRFSLTVSVPITTSSWRRGEEQQQSAWAQISASLPQQEAVPVTPPAQRIQTDTWNWEAAGPRRSAPVRSAPRDPSGLPGHPGTWRTADIVSALLQNNSGTNWQQQNENHRCTGINTVFTVLFTIKNDEESSKVRVRVKNIQGILKGVMAFDYKSSPVNPEMHIPVLNSYKKKSGISASSLLMMKWKPLAVKQHSNSITYSRWFATSCCSHDGVQPRLHDPTEENANTLNTVEPVKHSQLKKQQDMLGLNKYQMKLV